MAADRQVVDADYNLLYKEKKIYRLKGGFWGIGIGLTSFVGGYLNLLQKTPFKTSRAKFLGSIMNLTYRAIQRLKFRLSGDSGLIISGFEKGSPVLINLKSTYHFKPIFQKTGYAYLLRHAPEEILKNDIVQKMKTFGGLLHYGASIEQQKDYLFEIFSNILRLQHDFYDFVSSEGDVVFAFPNGSYERKAINANDHKS